MHWLPHGKCIGETKPLNTTDRRAGVLLLKRLDVSKSPSSSVSGPEGQIERFREREALPGRTPRVEVFEGKLVEAQSNSISRMAMNHSS
jgi:hypothetical protein